MVPSLGHRPRQKMKHLGRAEYENEVVKSGRRVKALRIGNKSQIRNVLTGNKEALLEQEIIQ